MSANSPPSRPATISCVLCIMHCTVCNNAFSSHDSMGYKAINYGCFTDLILVLTTPGTVALAVRSSSREVGRAMPHFLTADADCGTTAKRGARSQRFRHFISTFGVQPSSLISPQKRKPTARCQRQGAVVDCWAGQRSSMRANLRSVVLPCFVRCLVEGIPPPRLHGPETDTGWMCVSAESPC